MLNVTVKTLDSQNHSFDVPDESTVKEFKEQIAPVLNITVDKQRLIFCGKVLKDEKKLSEYDVHGKVIHVVQSLPPQSNSSSTSTSSSNNSSTGNGSRGNNRDAAGFLLGAFSIPQDLVDPTQVQNIVHDVVSGMGEIGRNATVMSRASDDGTVDVHINLGRVPVAVPMQSEAQLRMNRVQTMLIRANHVLDTLEDGNNTNNGNVADSSSQTETGNGSSNSESENNTMETEPANSANENPLTSSLFDNNISNAEITSEINLDVPNDLALNPDRFRYEGLAHAAQAAISAAFATAAAAARAAATGNSVINNVSSVPLDLRTVPPEPMEESSLESIPIPPELMDTSVRTQQCLNIPLPPLSDSEPSSSTPQSETKNELANDAVSSTQSSTAATSQQDLSTETSSTQTTTNASETASNTRRSRVAGRQVQPSVQTLANLLDEVIRFNSRLLPHLEKVRDLIRTDAPLSGRPCGDAQRLFSRISQMLHFLSHAFHSLSDLHVNFTHAPPRSPRVRIISSASSTMLQGLPMQAQISISTTSTPSQGSNSNTTTTSNTTATANTTTTSNTTATTSNTTATSNTTSTSNTTTSVMNDDDDDDQPTIAEIRASLSRRSTNSTVSSTTEIPLNSESQRALLGVIPSMIMDQMIAATEGIPSPSPPQALLNIVLPEIPLPPSRSGSNTPTNSSTNETPTSQNETSSDTSARTSGRTPTANAVPPLNSQASISMPSLRNLIPVPLSSMGGLHTFDAGLPCHSVWALEPSRRRHNAGGSRSTLNQLPNLTPNFPGRQEDQLQQVISNIVMGLLTNHSLQQGAGTPGVAVFSTRSGDMARDSSTFTTATGQTNRDRVSRPERNASSPTGMHPRSASADASTDNSSVRHMLNNVGLLNKKITEVFPAEMANTNFVLLGNFFWFLATHLTFQDLLDIAARNFDCLHRIHTAIQNYLCEKVFQTTNPQTSDYNKVLAQILVDSYDELMRFIRRIGVSYPNTSRFIDELEIMLRKHLFKVFDALLDRNSHFSICYGQNVANACSSLFVQFLQLHSRYSNMTFPALERVFRTQLDPLVDRIDPIYQHPVRVLVLSSFFRLMQGHMRMNTRMNFPSSSRDKSYPVASSSTGRDRSSEEERSGNNQRPPVHEFSLTDFVRDGTRPFMSMSSRSNESGQSENGTAPALAAFARIAEQTSAILRGNNRTNDSSGMNLTEVVIRPESWHTSIPQDWVPIITRDVQRQRRQAPQAPFSNAYLSGMPSKRRKIMTNDTPTLLEHSQSTLSDMLLQAISSADVQPVTSIEEIKAEASQDTVLQASFTEHMKHTIQGRLQRDLDYCSEKFPNSEKYYKNI